LNWRLNRGLA